MWPMNLLAFFLFFWVLLGLIFLRQIPVSRKRRFLLCIHHSLYASLTPLLWACQRILRYTIQSCRVLSSPATTPTFLCVINQAWRRKQAEQVTREQHVSVKQPLPLFWLWLYVSGTRLETFEGQRHNWMNSKRGFCKDEENMSLCQLWWMSRVWIRLQTVLLKPRHDVQHVTINHFSFRHSNIVPI